MPANRHEEHDFESVCVMRSCLINPSAWFYCFIFVFLQDRSAKPGTRSGDGSESLTNKVRDLEAKLKGNRAADKKPKDLIRAIGNDSILKIVSYIFLNLIIFTGKLDKKNDWQLSALEKKIEENQTPGFSKDPHEKKVPKWNKDAFTDKVKLFVTVSLHE